MSQLAVLQFFRINHFSGGSNSSPSVPYLFPRVIDLHSSRFHPNPTMHSYSASVPLPSSSSYSYRPLNFSSSTVLSSQPPEKGRPGIYSHLTTVMPSTLLSIPELLPAI
ncbi:hypothetical protein I7I50_08235 [Histoplasma capsulatum G186AR]|uniref:Uncharacterized protein n=1 Tax=Ajellomyces capsulatus TaxID=5037 RepID=A0A8H8CZH6_AJECA|nr:hypothetical protein I7I52_05752 [Histoplasma capsulatum]QSS73455.1 hypothetical protein I7I50_08235 [Histoplasma capsulatum G186AR]